MATELFVRNPWYLRHELPPAPRISWSVPFLKDTRITTEAFTQFHLVGTDYRMLTVGVEETKDQTPAGTVVHPSWVYGDKQRILESYLREQHPMVVIAGLPICRPPFLTFYDWLSRLQEEYPDTAIHLHGINAFRIMFGLGFASADYDPLEDVTLGRVRLPCGRTIGPDDWPTWGKWFRMLGWNWRDIKHTKDRAHYSIAAAYWAAEYFRKEIPFSLRDTAISVRPGDDPPMAGDFVDRYRRSHAAEGDKIICDACSLAPHCKLYREGAVCTLNESPSSELAKMFGSRNSDKIIEGLNKLLAMNAERVTEARQRETSNEDGLDEKVTKLIDSMFNQGVKIAKLINPALTNPKLQIQIGLAQVQGGNAAPANQLAAAAIAELERRGHARENITLPMVEDVIREMTGGEPAAIEVRSVDNA